MADDKSANFLLPQFGRSRCSSTVYSAEEVVFRARISHSGRITSVSQFSVRKSQPVLSSGEETDGRLVGFDSPRCRSIGQWVISKFSCIWEEKVENFANTSLQDLLLVSHSLPGVTRRFWRVSALRPEDVLEICLAFERRFAGLDVESRDVGFLWRLFNWAENQGRDFCHLPRSYEIILSLLVRAGMFRKAGALLQRKETSGIRFCRAEMFDRIIEEYVKAREIETAIALYDVARARGIVLSKPCHNLLLDFLVETNEDQLALKVLMDMIDSRLMFDVKNHFEYEQKHVPDSHICNKILSSQCKHFGVEEGWSYLLQLEALGFQSDEMTFEILVNWSCKEGKLKDGFIYLSESISRNLKPNVRAYNALIAGVFVAGLGTYAKDIFYDMIENESECVKGNIEDALRVKSETSHWAQALSSSSYLVLLKSLCRTKFYSDSALNILDEMVEVREQLDAETLNLLIQSTSERKMIYKSRLTLDWMLKKGVPIDSETFSALILGICQEGDRVLLQKSLQVARDHNWLPGPRDCNALVHYLCKLGMLKEALQLLAVLLEKNFHIYVDICGVFLKEICIKGFSGVGYELEMIANGETADEESVHELLREFCRGSNLIHALQLLGLMFRKNVGFSITTFRCLVNDVPKSLEVLHSMMAKNLKPSDRSLRLTLLYLSCRGWVDKALELSRTMEIKGWLHSSVVQRTLVEALVSHGRVQEAELFLGRVEAKGLMPKNVDYDVLIKRFCQLGRLKKAVELLNLMLGKGGTPSDVSYNSVICGLCAHGAVDEALDFHEEILHRNTIPSIKSCEMLVHSLCACRRSSEAENFLVVMLKSGLTPSPGMYQRVIDQCCSDNNLPKASKLLHEMHRMGYEANFKTQWSIITSLSKGDEKNSQKKKGFLSQLLSHSSSPVQKRA
ncbi:hypothetical protein H6P81_002171 [Aristolochia fimbriata]|uniref:Pentatricopeptide repeat-containing protein n=1 Tax=Aristolochia fimbriata TaxID=158543 RepID=A0AAV7F9Q9_ARIFI|nr:hypothetical protein H6P81_002171 [Aristolochia fimbriata]